jgi:glyoxylase-like metal-dependent hydrolase (beta-lactamase superfamily II)/rhodanese-related sulfurtransferase
VDLESVAIPGLGDTSYLLGSDGEGLVVDPQRDVGALLDLAEADDLRVRYVLETHVHNDYVSGAMEIHRATGAEVVGPTGSGFAFAFHAMSEGDDLRLGSLRVVAMATPGHTPEHTSYLVYEEGSEDPVAVFTGGSLLVAGAGRTDLLGPDRTDELTRRQFRSIRRLAELPDAVRVLPTHGAGSFCVAGPPPEQRVSTIGAERQENRALGAASEDVFVKQQLDGLLAFPTYYRQMAPMNRAGPDPVEAVIQPVALSPSQVEQLVAEGAQVVDGRGRAEFAAAHLPGSINIELDDAFASYVGWLVPFGADLVLVVPEPSEDSMREAATQLLRIGYERVLGHLVDGVPAWRASGRDVRSYPLATIEELCDALRSGSHPFVLDVRQRTEWEAGHLEGSVHRFVGDLPGHEGELEGAEAWVICRTGHRSAMAASLLDRAGVSVRLVADRGVDELLRDCPSD